MTHPVSEADASMIDPGDIFYTQEQVSIMLGVATRTLKRWRLAGDGPRWHQYNHKTVRYRRRDVEEWLADREGGQAS